MKYLGRNKPVKFKTKKKPQLTPFHAFLWKPIDKKKLQIIDTNKAGKM